MKILSSEVAKHYQLNSLQRGHLVFTSFISFNGKILFLDSHIERLLKGADFLFPNNEWLQMHEKIKHYVEDEFLKSSYHSLTKSYFRLTIFDDCLYLNQADVGLFPDSLKLSWAVKVKTQGLIPAYLKLPNYLESDLELSRAQSENYNEIVFFDNNQNITEASSSNIFIVNQKGVILTPLPSSIVLEGITRKKLFSKLLEHGFNIKEAPITKDDLNNAKEIWLTNSIKGFRFVDQFEKNFFEKKNSIFLKAMMVFGQHGELV